MTNHNGFEDWFQQATGHAPYPFQVRFACDPELLSSPSPRLRGEGATDAPRLCKAGLGKVEGKGAGLLVDVPTGMGKTVMAVFGWREIRSAP